MAAQIKLHFDLSFDDESPRELFSRGLLWVRQLVPRIP